MQFKSIWFCRNPCGHGKQLSRAAVCAQRTVTSQASTLFIFLFNRLQLLPCPFSLYFFSPQTAFLSLFNTFSHPTASPFPSLSSLSSYLQHIYTSLFLNTRFPSFWQSPFCCTSWVHVEACYNLCQECVALVWQECMEAIRWDVNAFQLPSLCRMSFLVLAPVKCCSCSSAFAVSMVADPILSRDFLISGLNKI